jgi:hypothetical protein
MAPSLLLLFNHTPTEEQVEHARRSLGVQAILNLPADLKPVWDSVPPGLETIEAYLEPIRAWVMESAQPGDFLLVQGDFGAVYLMVRFAVARNLVPIYSTTDRKAVETHQPDGSVRLLHTFKHERFRRYGA